ncbi:MAB_1171c family putative transporter [Streptomyces sp. KL2]|uniref:MAB_1171c family putative transporter n=1 Tax=Streptomyces sp. KL2 TaxID=3050126 RepID=UPI003979C96E
MDASEDVIPHIYYLAAAVALLPLFLKMRSIIRARHESLLRVVSLLLIMAFLVLASAAPQSIALINRTAGVANIAAPWVYSLLTAFSACCLLMLIAWRDGISPAANRAMRSVIVVYSLVIVALWVLFALGDPDVERLRDFDTYYANEPYLREMIMLYIVAHTVADIVNFVLLRSWEHRVRHVDAWLRAGLLLMGAGYIITLGFNGLKLAAVIGRWSGHDLDWLSTQAAPLLGAAGSIVIGAGFLIPHAGQAAHEFWRAGLRHRRLLPLYRLLKQHVPAGPSTLVGKPDIHTSLTIREKEIRDSLYILAPYLDHELHRRARRAVLDPDPVLGEALGRRFAPREAEGVAGAVAVVAAIAARAEDPDRGAEWRSPDNLLRDIEAVSRALRHPGTVETVRRNVAARPESAPTAWNDTPAP